MMKSQDRTIWRYLQDVTPLVICNALACARERSSVWSVRGLDSRPKLPAVVKKAKKFNTVSDCVQFVHVAFVGANGGTEVAILQWSKNFNFSPGPGRSADTAEEIAYYTLCTLWRGPTHYPKAQCSKAVVDLQVLIHRTSVCCTRMIRIKNL